MTIGERIKKIRIQKNLTQEELAKRMGKKQSTIANKLRLLTLPDEIQDSLLKEQISERHARALLNLTDAPKQIELLKKIINQKMSVRAVEEEIKRLKEIADRFRYKPSKASMAMSKLRKIEQMQCFANDLQGVLYCIKKDKEKQLYKSNISKYCKSGYSACTALP